MVELISDITSAELVEASRNAFTCFVIPTVAFDVCSAGDFTFAATTADPLPASPARAASIVAFSANRLFCSAISVMNMTTSPICSAAFKISPTLSAKRSALRRLRHRKRVSRLLRNLPDRRDHLFGRRAQLCMIEDV